MKGQILGFAALLAGCLPEEGGDGVRGSPRDVATEPGEHDGYSVSDSCEHPSSNYGLLGAGAEWYGGVAPEDEARPDALSALTHEEIAPALEDVPSVWGIGWGLACDTVGVVVWLDDWRDVDAVIERAGAVLREGNLREEIAVSVSGVPVPQ